MKCKRLTSITMTLCFTVFASTLAYAQITANWFDINPSKSNTDASNPNSASGGRIQKLGAASDMSRVYATSEWGGLYVSLNQGLTWTRVQTFSPSVAYDVKVIPGTRTVLVTSSFDGRAIRSQSGISISTDAGTSWTTVPWPTAAVLPCANFNRQTAPSGWQIAIDPTNPNQIYVGTNCGLAISTDGGANWQFVDPSPADNAEQIYHVVASGAQTIDVIGDNGYFRSTNSGGNWSVALAAGVNGPTAARSGPTSSLAVSPAENYVVYASTVPFRTPLPPGSPPGTPLNPLQINIFESVNAGVNWPTSLTFPGNVQGRVPFIKTNQLSTSSQYDVWFGDINVFKTTATVPTPSSIGGPQRAPTNSWVSVQSGGHADVADVLFDARFSAGACPSCFANDGGVYRNTRTVDPLCQFPNWEQPEITPHGTWLYGMDGAQIVPGVHGIYYGLQDNGLWGTGNALEGGGLVPPWTNPNCCDVVDIAAQSNLVIDTDGAYNAGRQFRVNKSGIGLLGRTQIPTYPSPGLIAAVGNPGWSGGDRVLRFGNNSFALGLNDGVHITSNMSSSTINWTFLGAPPVGPGANTLIGSLKTASIGGTRNFYAYTSPFAGGGGDPENTGQLFQYSGTAPGGTWNQLNLPPGIGSITVYDVDPTNGNRVIISGINAVNNQSSMWITPDFGGTWNSMPGLDNLMYGNGAFVNPNQVGSTTNTLAIATTWQPSLVKFNPLDPSTIIAGAADAGVFLTLDNGTNWNLISTPTNPNSTNPHIPRPIYAYFGPGRFNASTTAFDVWVGTRGAGVQKVVIDVGG